MPGEGMREEEEQDLLGAGVKQPLAPGPDTGEFTDSPNSWEQKYTASAKEFNN